MQQRFNPHRQGAKHVLEETDVLILRGTPTAGSGIAWCDTRIWVSHNGHAERAVWVLSPKRTHVLGPSSEFHIWAWDLDARTIAALQGHLDALAKVFGKVQPAPDPNGVFKSIRFWHDGQHIEVSISDTAQASITSEMFQTFEAAWDAIHRSVPEGRWPRTDLS